MTVKRTQVVMLPTKKASVLTLKNNFLFTTFKFDIEHPDNQHLYFLSDEEPKHHDHCYYTFGAVIQFDKNEIWDKDKCKKIIATTDSSLKINKEHSHPNSVWKLDGALLPQPSQDFIKVFVEEYNKGNVIELVDVDYEEISNNKTNDFGKKQMYHQTLKVNSKNEITIRKIKDSWSREEVVSLIKEFDNSIRRVRENEIEYRDKWISKNL